MTWSETIKAERAQYRLSQSQLAKLLSGPSGQSDACSVRTVQDWELGRNKPPGWVQWQILGTIMRATAIAKPAKGITLRIKPVETVDRPKKTTARKPAKVSDE